MSRRFKIEFIWIADVEFQHLKTWILRGDFIGKNRDVPNRVLYVLRP